MGPRQPFCPVPSKRNQVWIHDLAWPLKRLREESMMTFLEAIIMRLTREAGMGGSFQLGDASVAVNEADAWGWEYEGQTFWNVNALALAIIQDSRALPVKKADGSRVPNPAPAGSHAYHRANGPENAIRSAAGRMDAVVVDPSGGLTTFDVWDRFDFEDRVLHTLVPARLCQEYTNHQASPYGVRAFPRAESRDFEARPYLEFDRHNHHETHFQVIQEGKPTGFKVVLGNRSWGP